MSELEDPTPGLFGAEMIMTTGIAVPRGAERQRAYLERLDDTGVACLALSEGLMVPPLTRAFLAAADERGFSPRPGRWPRSGWSCAPPPPQEPQE